MSQKITYRVTAFFKRKPGITEEEFSHRMYPQLQRTIAQSDFSDWYNIHGPLCVPWIIKHGITQYTQVSLSPLQIHFSFWLIQSVSHTIIP